MRSFLVLLIILSLSAAQAAERGCRTALSSIGLPSEIKESEIKKTQVPLHGNSAWGRENDAHFLILKSGERFFFRPKSSADRYSKYPKQEVAAFVVSALYQFDVVPETILAKVGAKSGSLQKVINGMDGITYNEKKKSPIEFSSRILLFDLLIQHDDRSRLYRIYDDNFGNVIVKKDRQWAIDNSGSFMPWNRIATVENQNYGSRVIEKAISENLDVIENFRRMPDREVRSALKPYLNREQIEALIERKNYLIELAEK